MIMNIFALCCAVKVGSCWMHVENIQINWYLTCLLYVLIMWCQVNTWNMSHVTRVIISKMSFIWLCQKKNSRARSIWNFANSILQCIDSYYNLYKNTVSEHRTHVLLLTFPGTLPSELFYPVSVEGFVVIYSANCLLILNSEKSSWQVRFFATSQFC